jgi:transposase
MLYIGLDVHKEFCQACVIDESGRALSNERFSSTSEELDRYLDRFQDAKFVLESTGVWEFIYEGIEKRGFEAVLAHPLKVRAIAEARVKTDKVDAETLAQLLRADLIPRSWIPPKDIRDLRQLVRQRAYLVRDASRFKNRIHAEILRRGVRRPENLKTPFAQRSIRWMRSLGIPTVTSCLNCLENVRTGRGD